MMYRPNTAPPSGSIRRGPASTRRGQASASGRPKRKLRVAPLAVTLACVAAVVAVYGFYRASVRPHTMVFSPSTKTAHQLEYVEMNRLSRDQIPELNLNTLDYGRTFDDINDTQLVAARRNGLRRPELVSDPSISDELLPIASNDLYVVEPMSYAKPYLVPDAVLMLQYIGLRFQELVGEAYPDRHIRFIVTSALRSQDDVQRLRRSNRNATETSCHCFGTTIDITYIRFRDENGNDLDDLRLKNLLSQTLYELRYEGICYVKYERRQGCYHLTLRNVDYTGTLKSERQRFVVPKDWSSLREQTTRRHRRSLPRIVRHNEQPRPAKEYTTYIEY